ncbi:MAG: hypothetical protein WCJ91_07630 [Actinomycetes bacterium]
MKRVSFVVLLASVLVASSWGSATAQCTTSSCLTVSTDIDNSDVVATVVKRALAGMTRTTSPVIQIENSPGRCQPPIDFPGICTPPVVVRKPSPVVRESVRKHIPDLTITVEPREAVVAIPVNAYLRPLPRPFTLSVSGFDLRITVKPSVHWSFGDGATREAGLGDPYPAGVVMHSYRKVNLYLLSAQVIWNVFAETSEGETVEVIGDPIVITYASHLRVRSARGHLISTSSRSRS